jgi:hypothetical protein
LRSGRRGTYLTIPDDRFPGRHPVRFFLSHMDAQRLLTEALKVNPALAGEQITPVPVKLLKAIRSLAADKTPGHADSFVVHSPNEVFEFLQRQRPD